MIDVRARLEQGLDQYEIDGEVGEGGMAVVYLARDTKHDRPVAIKAMKPTVARSLGSERFLREIEIAAKLSHPHVLPLYDSGEVDGLHYFVMPFVEGESLRERLDREGALDVDEAIRIGSEVASALDYAHQRGLIHRDVKPANILLQSGHAVVADFGIARAVQDDAEGRLTSTGMSVGTFAYMSPEQALGEAELDGRTDVYALGCVVYEMLEGTPPFGGATPQAVMAQKVTGAVPDFSGDVPVPPTVTEVVRRALSAGPQDRYSTPTELATALRSAATSVAIDAQATRARRTRRNRVGGMAAGVAIVAALGWLALGALSGPAIQRIAVLPFENETGDPDEVFFIDGMHDALITEMQRAGLEVISRRSVMSYRDDATPVRDIASTLDLDAVVEGFAYRRNDSVGVRLRLVDPDSEVGLWTGSFGESTRNVLRVYRGATGAIAEAIGLALPPEVLARLASAPEVDPEAYDAYLIGRGHWNRLTPEDLRLAEGYFERSLAIDPDYALAHAGISLLWGGMQQMGLVDPAEAQPRIRAAAERAYEADSTAAEVHFARALLSTWTDWDWEAGEAGFLRTLEINPRYADAHAYYAHLLTFLGRGDEAIEQARLAVEIDPLSPLIGALTCVGLSNTTALELARERCEEVLRADPSQPVAMDGLGGTLLMLGDLDGFLEIEALRARSLGDVEFADSLERGGGGSGADGATRAATNLLLARAESEFVPPTILVLYLSLVGETERALDWLEVAAATRDPATPYFLSGAMWSTELATHLRYRALAAEIGLPAPVSPGSPPPTP